MICMCTFRWELCINISNRMMHHKLMSCISKYVSVFMPLIKAFKHIEDFFQPVATCTISLWINNHISSQPTE